MYVSFDDGESWDSLQLNPVSGHGAGLPPVPIHDMVIRDGDLAVATHGRSLWILDDLATLHQFGDVEDGASAHLFRPRPTYRILSEPYGYWSQAAGRTKHYQLSLGIPATYRIDETEHGTRSITPIDAGQKPARRRCGHVLPRCGAGGGSHAHVHDRRGRGRPASLQPGRDSQGASSAGDEQVCVGHEARKSAAYRRRVGGRTTDVRAHRTAGDLPGAATGR